MRLASPLRLALIFSLALTASCGDGTSPPRPYVLQTVNGMPLPVPLFSGSSLLIQYASITVGSGGRVLSIVTMVCASVLPPETTCVSPPEPTRSEGTYSEEDGTVTYGTAEYEATISEDEAVIWFNGGGVTGSFPQVWVYQR